MQNIALMNKASSDDTRPHAKHMEELLMYQRAKTKGLEDMLAKGLSVEEKDYIRQKLEADEIILNLTRKVTELERSENKLKSENCKLKFEVLDLKDKLITKGSASKLPKVEAVAENREVLNFSKKPFVDKENMEEESKEIDHLIRKLNEETLDTKKNSAKKKVAQFSDSVNVIEYEKPEATEAESRVKRTNTVINAKEESEKFEREQCAQQ